MSIIGIVEDTSERICRSYKFILRIIIKSHCMTIFISDGTELEVGSKCPDSTIDKSKFVNTSGAYSCLHEIRLQSWQSHKATA